MAEVYVNSWTEFITAVGVAGDTVILPEEATWDMNEIAPLGVSDIIYIRCAVIEGRGTRIKNLNITGYFNIVNAGGMKTINNLFITDYICSGNEGRLFWLAGRVGQVSFNGCAFAGMHSADAIAFCETGSNDGGYAYFTQCSINLECASTSFVLTIASINTSCKYCRVELHLPNSVCGSSSSTGSFGSSIQKFDFCEMVLYIPKLPKLYTLAFTGCTVRGNLQIASEDAATGSWSGNISVYSTDSFGDGFTPLRKKYFIGVSEEQLKSPAYLRSLGFPIVV